MTQRITILSALLGMLFWADQASAVPTLVPVQGTLLRSDGTPVDDMVDLTFVLYSEETGGLGRFIETQTDISVDGGAFFAYLGTTEPLDLAMFQMYDALWLEVIVDGTEIIRPRFRLATVPYAATAQYCAEAATLGSLSAEDLQARVIGSCPDGSAITAIDAAGDVSCSAMSTSGVTAVTAGLGLEGGGSEGEVSLAVDPTQLNGSDPAVPGAGGGASSSAGSDGYVTLNDATVQAPVAGRVVVMGSTIASCYDCLPNSGTTSADVAVGWDTDLSGTPQALVEGMSYVPSEGVANQYTQMNPTLASFHVYTVTAGEHTFYFRGAVTNQAGVTWSGNRVTAVFIPN